MQWKNIISTAGLLVVVSAIRMGKYPLFTTAAKREGLVKKIEAQNAPKKGAEYRGLDLRR